MIINSISLKNFQCYFGELHQNQFNFTDGLNLIIGDNGGGKSKLFDGFYWVIYDQVFNSDTRRFLPTSTYKENLISNKAKYLCDVGQSVSAEVQIIAKTGQGIEYKLTRIFEAKKTHEREWVCASASKLLIDEFKGAAWSSIDSSKHKDILKLVIPPHLKPYMWFQGEQVDDLMDFTDKSTLTNSINILSDISTYDELKEIVRKRADSAARAHRNEKKKLSKNDIESERLSKLLNAEIKKINEKESLINTYRDNIERADKEIESLVSKIDDAEKRLELKQKRAEFEQRIIDSTESLDKKLNGLTKKLFNDAWILKGSEETYDKFTNKYLRYIDEHNQKLSETKTLFKLPQNIPQAVHINRMLEDEKCYVCDREAPKGTEAYDHIHSLLDRDSQAKSKNAFVNDCLSVFQKLHDNATGFKHLIRNINSKISEEFSELSGLRERINKSKEEIKKIDYDFEELIEDDNSENIVNSYKTHQSNRNKYSSLLEQAQNELRVASLNKEKLELELDNLVVGEVDRYIVTADQIFQDLSEIADSTRNEVFDRLVSYLESKANELFQKMAHMNQAITGNIKFRKEPSGKYIPEIVGSDGYTLNNPNDSNIILVKLAIIMAIVTSRGEVSRNYSLISDAPTAKMAENYTHGLYMSLSKVFTQSIVMTYDFLDDIKLKEAVNSFKVGSVHKIKASFPNGDSLDTNDLQIKVEKVY